MSLYKKKNKIPLIFHILNEKLAFSMEEEKSCFYIPIEQQDFENALRWCHANNARFEPSHITNNHLYYKFWGWALDEE